MSNMIKSYAVKYDGDVITIDTHLSREEELLSRRRLAEATAKPVDSDEFTQGIKALVVEQIPTMEEQKEKATAIVEDAAKKAQQQLEEAKQEAEALKIKAYEAAKKNGYEDGLNKAKEQSQKLQSEYEAKSKELQIEYQRALSELEPKMVEIMSDLIEKITGILAEDKEEVILHLVSKALHNMDRCNEYIVRVSEEDYPFLSERKPILMDAIGREVALSIVVDTDLLKNQCLIETDLKVINCSLDVQLNNLITDLKLLGSI